MKKVAYCKEMSARGFTLAEVLIAMFVFSIGILALFSLAGSVIKGTDFAKKQTQAMNLAAEKLELLKASDRIPYTNIELTGNDGGMNRTCAGGAAYIFTCTPTGADNTDSDPTVMIEKVTYNWSWKVTYKDLNGNGQFLAPSGGPDNGDIKMIEVDVTWTDLFGFHTLPLKVLRKF